MKYKSVAVSLLGLGLIGWGLTPAPAFAAQPARPGTVNYVEGAVYVNGLQINPKQIGDVDLNPGEELCTGNGKAEILLTPGVFLRVGDNSAVKMISPDLTMTQVQVEKGRAGVEVDEIHDQNNLQIVDAGITTRLQKTGYYEFDASKPEVMVFKGKAEVEVAEGRGKEVKAHHEFALDGQSGKPAAQEKPASFSEDKSQDELMNWSALRSQYLAEANNELAPEYAYGGYYPGWYWDPYGFGYTFIGAGQFYSPFGWGFYPIGWGGGWYGGWGGWYGGRGYYGHHFEGHGGFEHGGFTHSGGIGGGGFHGGGSHGR
jgi:hypothetical protein